MTEIPVYESDVFTAEGHSYAAKKGTYSITIAADGSYSIQLEFIEVN